MSSRIERDRAIGRAVARARLAPLLSWLAAALALGFVLVFLIQAGLFAALMPRQAAPPVTVANPEQITAHNSTVTGFDRERQPYEVKAVLGYQDKDRPDLVHLETVNATFRKATGQSYTLAARTALYDTKSKQLELEGDVAIEEKGRFTARMERAHVAVEEKTLTADVPVTVEMQDGVIRANGLQITDDGRNILFLNGVRSRFAIEAAKGDGSP
jgi:lipopolysaccharide export system protein LptC